MEDCIFCKIVVGEVPTNKVYEDEDTLAFLDRAPNNPGHTLVVPKKHYANIFDIEDAPLTAVMRTVRRIAPAIRAATDASGLNIRINNESAAGQDVFHFHAHLIPRHPGDGLTLWHGKEYPAGEAAQVAAKIREKLS